MNKPRRATLTWISVALLGTLVCVLLLLAAGGRADSQSVGSRALRPAASATESLAAPAELPAELASPLDESVASPSPSAEANRLGSPLLIESDLGSGSVEFSAVALNELSNRLIIADDAGLLFEFDLSPAGEPVTSPRRVITVAVGAGDVEGIAWMYGSTYVIAHENDGRLTVVEFDDEVTTIESTHLLRTIDTGVREVDGKGIEGVAYAADTLQDIEFIAVLERPPALLRINHAGEVTRTIPIALGVSDISDVWSGPDGSITLVSDEGRRVFDIALDGGVLTALESVDLTFPEGRFEQPEGVARSRDNARLYVVGEDPGSGQFVFGLWRDT